jgi:hypothetical protein
LLTLTKENLNPMPMYRLSAAEWNRRRNSDELRRQALMRLYARKEAVDDLIRSLEEYQRFSPARKPQCAELSVAGR